MSKNSEKNLKESGTQLHSDMLESETSKILHRLSSEAEKAGLQYLVETAKSQLLKSVMYKYIEELSRPEKIKSSNPLAIINCISKLLKITKEINDPKLNELKEKLIGVGGNVKLSDLESQEE